MTGVKKIGEKYKCQICGNVVEVKVVGGGELVCCGKQWHWAIENNLEIILCFQIFQLIHQN